VPGDGSGIEQPALHRSRRVRTEEDQRRFTPVHAVWEITLACNLKCLHCGSRAGRRRPDELTTAECLDVVAALARLGTREVTLIGGEAFLRPDWTDIIGAVRQHGMYCAIQTGGRGLTEARLQRAIEAGLQGLGVSLDGLEPLHDFLRGIPGSYRSAVSLLERARSAGLQTSANTQIGAGTMGDLEALLDRLIAAGVTHWQLQLTVAMGNAVDHDELLLQPYQLRELMPLLASLYDKGIDNGLLIVPGNNMGYFGPYEHRWRSASDERSHWSGCSAGQTVIALEADGTVKGCPSLPTTDYAGGNVRDLSLEQIWATSPEIHFGRLRTTGELWGFCGTCYYADVCRGGCSWTTHSLLGTRGNNPYCSYRVEELAREGFRERVVKRAEAANTSFAVGEFDLVLEPLPGPAGLVPPAPPDRLGPSPPSHEPRDGAVAPTLDPCPSCWRFVWPCEQRCPFCDTELEATREAEAADRQRRLAALADMEAILSRLRHVSSPEGRRHAAPGPGSSTGS
jgi:Y-X(10)_GDL-associated radical SAM protein